MNNLHRELAPVSAAAWADLEEEATRTFARHAAARKAVDVTGPDGLTLAGLGTGHVTAIDPPSDGVAAALRDWRPVVELRVPFTLSRAEIDSAERGALDADWQPVKDAAKKMAFAEDHAVFDGYAAARITGIRQSSSNPALALPGEPKDYPDLVSKALSALRLAGVDGPYSLLLSAGAWTAVSETSDHGYPVIEHIKRLLDGDIVLGAGDRRRAAAVLPRRRSRAPPRPGPVDRLPVARRGLGGAVLHRVLHLRRLHHRGERAHHRLTRSCA